MATILTRELMSWCALLMIHFSRGEPRGYQEAWKGAWCIDRQGKRLLEHRMDGALGSVPGRLIGKEDNSILFARDNFMGRESTRLNLWEIMATEARVLFPGSSQFANSVLNWQYEALLEQKSWCQELENGMPDWLCTVQCAVCTPCLKSVTYSVSGGCKGLALTRGYNDLQICAGGRPFWSKSCSGVNFSCLALHDLVNDIRIASLKYGETTE